MNLFLNKTQSEKNELETKEQKLTKNLQQILDQLNRKEEECEANLNKNKELQVKKEELEACIRLLNGQIEQQDKMINRYQQEQEE